MKLLKNSIGFEYHYDILDESSHGDNSVETFNGAYDFMLDGTGLTILDVGANVGAFALWAMRRFPYSKIVCYEPIPRLFMVLKDNVDFYGIETNMKAISTEEDLTLCVDYSVPDAAGKDFKLQGANIEQIKVDTVHPKDVGCFDLIKINTEGAEVDIVPNLDLSKTHVVMVESHSDSKRRFIEDFMYSEGFFLRQSRFMISCGAECYQRQNLPSDKFRSLFLDENEIRKAAKV